MKCDGCSSMMALTFANGPERVVHVLCRITGNRIVGNLVECSGFGPDLKFSTPTLQGEVKKERFVDSTPVPTAGWDPTVLIPETRKEKRRGNPNWFRKKGD